MEGYEDLIDFENDPTMPICARREMRERVAYQLKLDAVRRAMPAELVDKSRIFYSEGADYMDKRRAVDSREHLMEGNADALTEEEIERVLEDVEQDSELTIIRSARLEELMELSKLNVNRGQEQVNSGQGEVQASDPARVLELITSGARVVILVTREEADLSPSQGEVSTGILKNMKALAKEFLGTSFLFCVLHSKFGDDLRSRLQISQLPALICCREGVIVSRVMGTALRQFVLMETLGSVIFQAWLNQACILCKSNKECPLVGEAEHKRCSRSCASEDSNDQSDSDLDGVNDSDTSDETNLKASFTKNGIALGPKTFVRAQTDKTAAEKALGPHVCRDPNCCQRGFFHQHLIGGVRSKAEAPKDEAFQLDLHDTH